MKHWSTLVSPLSACSSTGCIDTSTMPHVTYFYKAVPKSDVATGPISDEASATVNALGAPSFIQAAAASDPSASPAIPPQAIVRWGLVNGATSYDVKRFPQTTPTQFTIVNVLPQTNTFGTGAFLYDTSVSDGVASGYTVVPKDVAGVAGPNSITSGSVTPNANAVVGTMDWLFYDADRWTPGSQPSLVGFPGAISRPAFFVDNTGASKRQASVVSDAQFIVPNVPKFVTGATPQRYYVKTYGGTLPVPPPGATTTTGVSDDFGSVLALLGTNQDSVTVISFQSGEIRTASTSITIPSRSLMLSPGSWMYFNIAANYEQGRDAIANPDTNHQPYAFSAQVLTAKALP